MEFLLLFALEFPRRSSDHFLSRKRSLKLMKKLRWQLLDDVSDDDEKELSTVVFANLKMKRKKEKNRGN